MTVTPSEIFDLAVQRHRLPWNWTLHFAGVCGFGLTMLTHSFLMFAASLIVFGAGFFDLGLPPVKENRWLRFVHGRVEWEKNWAAAPWNWHKIWRFSVSLLLVGVALWALWQRDALVLLAYLGGAALYHVVRDNMAGGIRP